MKDLMDQFVCVRMVMCNAMDLSLFQFDSDLTFAVFFMNADKTIYGRFGTRSSRDETEKDVTLEGFRKSLAGALELHQAYPANRASLAAKKGPAPKFRVPEAYPALRGKYKATLDYGGQVAHSCIHCHQLRDAERTIYRTARQPLPEKLIFPWPLPDVVGLSLDPRQKATVQSVLSGSAASRAGFRPGDEIQTLQGQPILSIADVQWVLENTREPAHLTAEVARNGQNKTLTLWLPRGWRRKGDISWRSTTWPLRRMATGGLVLEDLTAAQRRGARLSSNQLALRVKHVGQHGAHAAAKRAGFRHGDIVVAFDGRSDNMSETMLLAHGLQKMPGTRVDVTVLRGGRRIDLKLPMQQ